MTAVTAVLPQAKWSDPAEREKRRKALVKECDEAQALIMATRPAATDDCWPYYKPRHQPENGTIYFVGPEGGPIKIGFASVLELRMKDLRTMNAYALMVHATAEGPPLLERQYHKRFAAHRLHGEWFAPHPDILAEIARLNSSLGITAIGGRG